MNDKKINNMADQLSGGITEGITQAMKPVFESLSKEIHGVMISMETQQADSMKRMADAFLGEMKASSETMFSGMTEGVNTLCKTQKACTEEMKVLFQAISHESADMRASQIKNVEILKELKSYQTSCTSQISRLEGIQNNLLVIEDKLNNKVVETDKVHTAYIAEDRKLLAGMETLENKIIEYQEQHIKESQKILDDRQKDWINNYKGCDEALNKASETAVKNMERMSKTLEQYSKLSDESVKRLELATSEFCKRLEVGMSEYRKCVDKDIEATFSSFDTQMSGIAKILGDTALDISNSASRIPLAIKGSVAHIKNQT